MLPKSLTLSYSDLLRSNPDEPARAPGRSVIGCHVEEFQLQRTSSSSSTSVKKMLSSVTDDEPPTRQVARKSTAKPARNLALQWAYKRKNENEEVQLELSQHFAGLLHQGVREMIRMQPLEQSMSESESAASDCESEVPTRSLRRPVAGQRVFGKSHRVESLSLSESETSVRMPTPSTSASAQRYTNGKSPRRLNGKEMIKKSIEAPPEKINFKQYRPGFLALKEIKYYQRISNLLIPKRNFQRVVREVMQKYKSDYCINVAALSALQEASEAFIVELFEKVNLAAIHASRVTITTRDLDLARRIGGYEFSRNLSNVAAKY
ncbi:unnamed protein product [Allacma fusca]|uniref:Core Histone H2A/H2B/H3 domain-containing protein n=1 Tax=Allacma fusca TaxID=39272 RepID=A0A8J2P2S1_9HEXA|nr:unnamed protein product [Allacma fusca]